MRLSEAMMLGSTVVKMQPGDWETCAIGAAATAMGIPIYNPPVRRIQRIRDQWPWLAVNGDGPMLEIVTLFDERVCRGHMTMDQLVAHVADIEPPCECGVRSCVCDRIEHLLPPSVEVVAEELEPAF